LRRKVMKKRVAIIGSGPAGYASAIYTSRAELETVIFAGMEPGGQLMKTTEIENFPGTAKGIVGPKLMSDMQEAATRFGGELIFESVESLSAQYAVISNQEKVKFVLQTETKEYEFDAVILAMGASSRMLGIGEEKYWGKGLSTCAVCDAAFYRDKTTYVVGGGDSAIEDAMALTKFAKEVHLLVRGDKLRASKAMQKRLAGSVVVVEYGAQVARVSGEDRIESIAVTRKQGDTVSQQVRKAEGLFLAIGHVPATKFLSDSGVELNEQGYVKTELSYPKGSSDETYWLTTSHTMTSVPGIFAAGDCVDFRYRQAAVASGMGVMAALDVEKWLENQSIGEARVPVIQQVGISVNRQSRKYKNLNN
jgi:thioredoxin reductase (NADPH)